MSFIRKCILCFFVICIVGCARQTAPFLKSDESKQCLAQCTNRFESCSVLCKDNCAICSTQNSVTALESFSEYVHEERVEGGYISRGLQSYRDPLKCRKITCNCHADLVTCEQNCTGVIHKQLSSVPYCT